MIYPNNFEQKIGFDSVKESIKQLCVNDLAARIIDGLKFSADYRTIRKRLEYSKEMFGVLENNINILPIYPIDDFRATFKASEVEGSFVDISVLIALRKMLENLAELVGFLSKKDRAEFPLLRHYADEIDSLPEVQQELHRILDKDGEIRDNATPELAAIRREKRQIQGSVSRTLQRILQKAQEDEVVEKDVSPVIREGRLVIPVIAMNKRKINGIIHDESATGKTFYIEPSEVVLMNNKLRELESEERKEITKILTAFTTFLRPFFASIIHSSKLYLQVDSINAIAKYSLRIGAICPNLNDECLVDWQKARHPILQERLKRQGEEIVPLDISLNEQDRIILISGANAGGKSVAIKTVCLLQYMLQCGLPIPISESSEAGIFSEIFLDIGDGQNIENDLSTYSSHLQDMKFFLKNSTDKTLIIIDEFGSGTEPEIGGAIAQATLKEFCQKGLYGVITTHYTNLKYFAEENEGIVNGAMLYDRSRLQPLFQLKIGQAGSSFALEIAQNIGLPASVIAEAKELVGSQAINYEKLTQSAIRDKAYWENKREKIRLQSKRQDSVIADYEQKLAEIEKVKKETIQRAKQEAQSIIIQANATIENTIRKIKESQADKEATSEARQEVSRFAKSISTKSEQKPPTKKYDTALKVNDLVSIKDQSLVGQIMEIKGGKAVVLFGQMRTNVAVKELQYVSNNQAKKASKVNLSKQTVNTLHNRQLSFSQEIDLRGMRVSEALETVMYYIDDALMAKVSQVRILHGTGEGALRQAIREYLQTCRGVKSFRDEHIQLGGAGITIVEL